MIFDFKHYLNYFRLWDNRMIFGGRAAFFPETAGTIRRSAEILQREMVQVYPQLKDVQVEYVWGGTLDFAFDMMTHVGEAGRGSNSKQNAEMSRRNKSWWAHPGIQGVSQKNCKGRSSRSGRSLLQPKNYRMNSHMNSAQRTA